MSNHHHYRHKIDTEEKDPVCKMKIGQKTATSEVVYRGQAYYFCSPDCLSEFETDPKKYLPEHRAFRS